VERSLVDPDNRRPVDFGRRSRTLADGTDAKQRVVAAALRARRELPACFGTGGDYEPVDLPDERWVGFRRGDDVVVIAPCRPLAVAAESPPVPFPVLQGEWVNTLGPGLPLALLVRS
jgi:(1->4)-alpha-D-glucan 1-alpha-D-glucosylmutase